LKLFLLELIKSLFERSVSLPLLLNASEYKNYSIGDYLLDDFPILLLFLIDIPT
jgi:hypothetical protein